MPDLVTRCPECGTRFNAATDQLDIAGGLVRCGVCLTVFDGRKHRDSPVETETPATAQDGGEPEALSPAGQAPTVDHLPAGADPAHEPDSTTETETPVTAQDGGEPEAHSPAGQAPTVDHLPTGADPAHEPDSITETETPATATAQDGGEPETYSPAGQAPDMDHPNVGACHQGELMRSIKRGWPKPAGEPEYGAELETPTIDTDTDAEPLRAPVLTSEVFAPGEQPPAQRPKTLLWTTLSLLALVTLAGQYTWFHANELAARFGQWRPQLEQFCELTRCELPVRSDLSRIQVNGLVVRTHPQQADALLVEARLVNRADFSQPLPPLTLQFEDLQGQPVARRTFTARQYAPDIAGTEPAMIASRQQVPVRLEISDPGPAAVSYLLSPARQQP